MKSYKLIIILLFVSLLGVSQNITRMEYFVDTDPGYGNGISIPFSGSEIAEADFTVPLNSLGNGIHFLYLRAQNQDGDWSVTSVHHILKDVFQGEDAVIDHAEYYIDNDPGFGNGTAISLSSGKVVDIAFNLDLSGLSTGLHFLNLRTRTNDGTWSLTNTYHILSDVFNSADAEISEIEYFFDNDPGLGNGIPVSVSQAKVVDVTFQADLSALSPGLHFLHTRAKTNDNTWGMLHNHPVFVDILGTIDSEITQFEYFIDIDPGIGNATSVDILPGKVVDVAFDLDVSSLDPGFHFLSIRSASEDNIWSHAYTSLFLMDVLDSGESPITKVEYFVDEDPGIGNATDVSITPGKVVEIAFDVDVTSLDQGFHFVSVRSASENNIWSHAYTSMFLMDVLDSGESPITKVEYFVDTDPGIGEATEVSITPGKVVDLAFDVDVSNLESGFHFVSIRSASENNVWSHAYTSMFLMDVLDSGESPITKVEYFVDTDPGIGEATEVSITPGKVVELAFDVDVSSLESGFHFVSVRSASADDVWSHAYTSMFLMDVLDTGAEPIVEVEYFIDDDPGIGLATQVSITPGKVVDLSFEIDLNGQEPGFHFVTVRSKSEAGVWSMGYFQMFYLDHISSLSNPDLVAVEYFLDEDPGFGNGTSRNINPQVPVADKDFIVSFGSVEPGEHILYMRAQDEFDNWSIVAYDTVMVEQGSYYALRFDGENDYLEAADVSFPEDELTIEAWINPTELSGYQEIAYWYGDAASVQFRVNPDGSILYGESGNGWSFVTSEPNIIPTNEWTHVALTKEGDLCNIYANGIQVGFYQFDNNPVCHTLQIGGRGNNMDRFFNGDIDEVRIWNVARTQEEIRDNFCGELTGNEQGIYGLWHCDQGPTYSVAYDFGPNGFVASLNNMEINAGPDCAWVDHSCELPPAINLAITSFESPEDLILASASSVVDITINVRNFGIESWDGNVTLSYQLDGGGTISENTYLFLNPGDVEQFTFGTSVDLSVPDSYQLTSSIAAPGDENLNNNTLTRSINSVEIARSVYAYNAYPNQSGLPEGPIVFDLENPETVFSLDDQESEHYFNGGTWMDGKWWAIANDTLYTVDTITGNRTFVGVPGSYISSMAYDPVGEKLYGHSWVSLYEIDPLSGSSTYVGYSGLEGFTALACNADGNLYALNVNDDQIYQLDKETGLATAIGPIGFDANYEQDMDFDPATGNIYLTAFNDAAGQGELRTLDPLTGNTTYLGTFRGGMEVTGFAIPFNEALPIPVADFIANPLSGKIPLEVQFNDLSTGDINSWYWDFGDGNFSIEQNPSHIYTLPGNYTVSLIVSGMGGEDTKTMEDYIVVNPITIYDLQFTTNPEPENTYPSEFTGIEVTVSGMVTATGYNGNNNEFFISHPDGGPWNSIFIYNANLPAYMGDEVVVNGLIQEYYGMTEFNSPQIIIVSNGNPVPEPQILTTGIFTNPAGAEPWESALVKTINTGLTTLPNGNAEWYINDGSGNCQVDDRMFYYEPNMGETFDFIKGIVDYSFEEYGLNPRFGEDIAPLLLVAGFTTSTTLGSTPLYVTFTDQSQGNIISWFWDFGDGTSSEIQNPLHTYQNPGIYTVSLTVSNGTISDEIIMENLIQVNEQGQGNWLAEYFFDIDPGYGNAIPIYGNGEGEVMITFNAPVNHLADGLHTFYSRSKNENGSWSQTMARPFIKQMLPEDADPNISYLEYFYDDDPGFGQATPIAVDALSPMEVAINLPLESLSFGLHNLFVRSQDENGKWSIVMQRAFIMGNYPADPLPQLVKAEYFIDEDPGQGLAEPVMFDPNNGIHEQEFDANLDGYEWGEHTLYLRSMDESGSWSITVAEPFNVEEPPIIAEFSADITTGAVPLMVQFTDETYVSVPTEWLWNFGDGNTSTEQNPNHIYGAPGIYTVSLTSTNLEGTDTEIKEDYITVFPPIYSLEYFFDQDPGYGNGTGVYAYSSSIGGFNFLAPVDDLDDGYHLLFVRVKDTSGVWNQTMTRSFLKTRLMSDPDPNIVQVEYFVNDDPGFGQASSIPVSQSPVPIVETLIPLDGYTDGLHNIFFRSQDENGRWSECMARAFLKSYVPGELTNVSGLEYFMDEDPGVGFGTQVSVPNSQANVERSFVVNLEAQIPGEHRLFVRAVDERGHWSIVYNQLIEVTATGAVQVVLLPEGWSGISSFVIPDDPAVETIFEPVVEELVILQNFAGMYWPTAGVNTLVNWDEHAGYQIKMETAQQVTFTGEMQNNLTANLNAGWNYLPVLNACDNDAEELFGQIIDKLQIVKEVAGTGVYWPQFGVNTLGEVIPGKAYFVLVDEEVGLEFPICENPSNSQRTPSNSPWRGRTVHSSIMFKQNDPDQIQLGRIDVAAMRGGTPSPQGEVCAEAKPRACTSKARQGEVSQWAGTPSKNTPSNSPLRGRTVHSSIMFKQNDPDQIQLGRIDVAAMRSGAPSPQGEGCAEVGLCVGTPLSLRSGGEVQRTPITHTIAIPVQVISGLAEGNILTIYNKSGLCCGAVVFQNQNLVLTAFGDDPTTSQVDGLAEGEALQFRVYNPETGNEFPLEVEFDEHLPQGGYFVNHGLSAIKSLESTGVEEIEASRMNISVYPNPSTGMFRVSTLTGLATLLEFEWEVTDTNGSVIAFGNNQSDEFVINLSTHSKGIYYLKITQGGLQTVKKLVVQ